MADQNVDLVQDPYSQQNQQGQQGGVAGAVNAPQADPNAASGQGGGTAGGAAPTAGGASNGPSTSKTGTGFVNIQNVLNANKGTGQQLGNAIGSGITQAASNVGQELGTAQQQFGQQAAAGTVGNASDQTNAQNIINSITNYQAPASSVNQVGSGNTSTGAASAFPTGTTAPTNGNNGYPTQQNSIANPWTAAQISAYQAANPNPSPSNNLATPLDAGLTNQNVSQFQNYLSGQYTGPTQLSGIDQITQQAQQAQALGQNINTAGGQNQLLQQFVGGNNANYGAGAQALDQLLLGQGGAQPLQQAAQKTLGLTGQVAGAQSAAEDQAAYNQAMSSQFGTGLKNQLTAANASIMSPVQQALANAQAQNTQTQNQYNTLQTELGTNNLDNPEILLQLAAQGAITPDQQDQLSTLINQGFVNPNNPTNAAYNTAEANLTGNSSFAAPTTYLTNQQALNQGLISQGNSSGGDQPSFDVNPDYTNAQQNLTGNSPIAAPTSYLTNQQAISQGLIAGPQYTTLQQLGIDPETLLKNNLTNTQAQGLTAGAFVNPTQSAQLNALAQLSGQQNNPLTQNAPKYTAAQNTLNFGNLMGQVTPLEQAAENSTTQAGYQAAAKKAGLGDFINNNILSLNPLYAPLNNATGGLPGQVVGAIGNTWGNAVSGAANAISNAFSGWSDENLKKDIKDGEDKVSSFLDSLKPYSYEYKSPNHGIGNHLSVMAQDLEKTDIGKQAIEEHPEGKKVRYDKLAAMMLASQASLNKRLKKLESK